MQVHRHNISGIISLVRMALACMYVCVYVSKYACMNECMYLYMYVCVNECMYLYMYV